MKKRAFALLCLCILLAVCALPVLAAETTAPQQTPTEDPEAPTTRISVPVVATVIAVGAAAIALTVLLPTAIKAKKNP